MLLLLSLTYREVPHEAQAHPFCKVNVTNALLLNYAKIIQFYNLIKKN
jgi:hypothetical protein